MFSYVLIAFALHMACVAGFTKCTSYYEKIESATAKKWCQQGAYFTFSSTIPVNHGQTVNIFYNCQGQKTNPHILLIHGWPTSSYDFQDLVDIISQKYFVCTMDFPGHGFSEKLPHPFAYSIFDYAKALDQFVTKVVPLKEFMLLTHDEGDSVGFQFLRNYMESTSKLYNLTYHFVLNGGIYLPLTHLTEMQKKLLSNETGPDLQKMISGAMLAAGMGSGVFTPPLNKSEVAELTTVFDFESGSHILHETIQYLGERMEFENIWLDVLGKSPVPCTLMWGEKDGVCVTDVADYVWKNYLENRKSAAAEYIKLPKANHYVQHDDPIGIANIIMEKSVQL